MILRKFSEVLAIFSKIPGGARWRRARLRAVMGGYRWLKVNSRLGAIGEIKDALSKSRLDLSDGKFGPSILGAAAESMELALRQYLLMQRAGIKLNCAILMAAANPQHGIAYGMPEDWRRIVRLHGFPVSDWLCKVNWIAYVFRMWCYGAAKALRIITDGVRFGRHRKIDDVRYAYFVDLSPANLPPKDAGMQSHDIISWYALWQGRDLSISTAKHGVLEAPPLKLTGLSLCAQRGPLHPLAGISELSAFISWFVFALVKSAVDALHGHWWHAVLLGEAASAAHARFLPPKSLAAVYMFHNSGWIYRPLWTYEAERKGSKVAMYFYSTNCEPFKLKGGYSPMHYGYRAMNWPRYLVWDNYQADFVRRATECRSQLDIVGPIWFQGASKKIDVSGEFAVAVFDVTPYRTVRYCTLGLDSEYYTASVLTSFLEDIESVVRRYQGVVVWKQKRNVGRSAHPYYRHLLKRVEANAGILMIDTEVSAISVIRVCDVSISLPFTSTALIARDLGKPSIYYDPIGFIMKDDRAAHGIPVISGRDALESWVEGHILKTVDGVVKNSALQLT
jgi:polysaccharide biosynthesis PFTS motif protein